MEQVISSLNLSKEAQAKFKAYYDFLKEENEKYNLTSITDLDEVYIKHFYDSSYALNCFDLSGKSLADIGSGAGFPGVVLKIINNDIKLTLIEPTKKRADFLKELCNKLELRDVTIINDRAENAIKDLRESFDFVTARAVSNLRILLELTIPYLKVGGSFIAYKGLDVNQELEEAKNALKKLNSKVVNIYNYKLLNDLGERSLIEVKKEKSNDLIFPRDYAKIKKKPL